MKTRKPIPLGGGQDIKKWLSAAEIRYGLKEGKHVMWRIIRLLLSQPP